MPPDVSSLDLAIAGLCFQALANLALAGIAWRFVRGKERSFLRLWSASWLCLAVYHGAVMTRLCVDPSGEEPTTFVVGIETLGKIASLWQIGLLLLGVYVARGGAPLRPRVVRIGLVATAFVGVGLAVLPHIVPAEVMEFARVAPRGAFGGIAFLVSGLLLGRSTWGNSTWGKGTLGPPMVAVAFLLYGASLLHLFAHEVVVLFDPTSGTYFAWTAFSDLLLQMLVVCGILLWVVEVEILAKHSMARQLRERDNQLNESQKMEALGRLAGGIAHDFNNLLTTVLGNVDWLRSSAQLEPSHRAALEDVEQSVRRGSAMTKQLQTLSRGNHHETVVEDLNAKVRELLPMLGPMVGANIQIKAHTSDRSCPIRIVKGQTEQVLLNLFINARDAMDTPGRIRVRTHCSQDEFGQPRVVLEVKDSGSGMDEATMDRMFEPFFSTKSGGMGTGLGMTSVWNIVENSGGAIRVESKIGSGTTITVDWPRSEAEVTLPRQPPKAVQTPGHLRILLAEDDDPVRQSTMRTLIEAGHDVVAVHDGMEALDTLVATGGDAQASARFDLVLSDVIMPRMEGTELAKRILQDYPSLPIALVSGFIGRDQERPGDIPLLRKPFTGRQLLAFVDTTHREANARAETVGAT